MKVKCIKDCKFNNDSINFEQGKEYEAEKLPIYGICIKHSNGHELGFNNDFFDYFEEVLE